MENKKKFQLHKEALDYIDGKPNKLEQTLTLLDIEESDPCMKGYFYLYKGDFFKDKRFYLKSVENWASWLDKIKREKDSPVKFSDLAWWNLQIANLYDKLKMPNSNMSKAKTHCLEAIKRFKEEKNCKAELFHNVLLAYIELKLGDTKGFSNAIDHIKKVGYYDEKPSLRHEIQGLIGIYENQAKEKVIESFLISKGEHILYLHKRRCLDLIKFIENGNSKPYLAGS